MSNPQINFRLSTFQLARGLKLIRQLEPNFQLTSINQIVKIIYIDYLSKMEFKQSNVEQSYIEEVENFLMRAGKKKLNLNTLVDHESLLFPNQNISLSETPEEKSEITTVSDFSPPIDWMNNEE